MVVTHGSTLLDTGNPTLSMTLKSTKGINLFTRCHVRLQHICKVEKHTALNFSIGLFTTDDTKPEEIHFQLNESE